MKELIREVNDRVNREHEFKDDQADFWMTPKEFDDAKCGDCEDYAISKYLELEGKVSDLWITYCFVENNQAHMVCEADGWLLDNRRTDIELIENADNLRIVYQFNRNAIRVGKTTIDGPPNIKHWKNMLTRMSNER